MNALLKRLSANPAVQTLLHRESGLGNLSATEEALLLAAAFDQDPQTMIVVKNNTYTAQRLQERLEPLLHDTALLFVMVESPRVEAIAASPELKASQIEVMARLTEGEPVVLIMNAAAFIRYLPSPEAFCAHCFDIHIDDEVDYEGMKRRLQESGYTRVSRVDQPLCYAARGGIIDVYSMNSEYPVRIEFFDNIIDSIRLFDVATQRTIRQISQVRIIPASDILLTDAQLDEVEKQLRSTLSRQEKKLDELTRDTLRETLEQDMGALRAHLGEARLYPYLAWLKDHHSISDYCSDAPIILSSEEEVKDAVKRIQEETIIYIQEMCEEGRMLPKFTLFREERECLMHHPVISVGMFMNIKHPISSQITTLVSSGLPFQQKIDAITAEARENAVVLCVEKNDARTVIEALNNEEIAYVKDTADWSRPGIYVCDLPFAEGFQCLLEHIIVYTRRELFPQEKKFVRYHSKFKEATVLQDYMELNVGDYVVHHQHGVGRYMGIMTGREDGRHQDYLRIVYRGNDELLVPLSQFHLIRRFVSKEGVGVRLNKLGSSEWEKTRRKVSEKVEELAGRLVELYALRSEDIGFAFSPDTPMQREFEDQFEYELTEDQQHAVEEIKHDMESPRPMDRLLCGDVGFGKTEVAVRAAFKAVMDNKQVAFLCPTTILSMQHYKTFIDRFRDYPVNIKVVNRFVPRKEQNQIIQDMAEGKVDIIIGTHRLLSKDMKWKDLGFLVIDEEQRFGVEHKERIKELKTGIDVLSLSATPIPRTLQMSLVGIRSLSQLNSPPSNRHPVQTYVIERNFNMIREIIQRELARNGQVFYLYNRIEDIYQVAKELRKAFPDIGIGVAHGQMDREDIEDVMMEFNANKYQVLVCTTIIETGIDIPNANTILIEDADRFGLSQLYQIRGRVGRSSRVAYAYLMYRPQKQLNETAMKRLKSIREFTQLGSGYKIAMRDLTIRGAGDLLGPQQAGFIDSVGIDMYMEMLHDAIARHRGLKQEEKEETPVRSTNVQVDAYIPDQFAPEDGDKLSLYQQIEKIRTVEELHRLMDEVRDLFGMLPNEVRLLFEKKQLDLLAAQPYVEDFKETPRELRIIFTKEWSDHVDGVKLFERMNQISRLIRLGYAEGKVSLIIPKSRRQLEISIEALMESAQFHAEY